jgi:hypothetical protein
MNHPGITGFSWHPNPEGVGRAVKTTDYIEFALGEGAAFYVAAQRLSLSSKAEECHHCPLDPDELLRCQSANPGMDI